MRLTPELAAYPARLGGDAVPAPYPEDRRPATDADHAAINAELLSGREPGEPIWIFAYGSLIWNPGFAFAERRRARLLGWHRGFCLGWDRWFRGAAERPGLMLALDRGGACTGVAYRLVEETLDATLLDLARREVRLMPSVYRARWLPVVTPEGPVRAFGHTISRESTSYVGRLPPEAVADALASASGPMGSMAEYLRSTVEHLEMLGIHDARLWRLQEMVADRIAATMADDG
jgi:cation transport protein ChaC